MRTTSPRRRKTARARALAMVNALRRTPGSNPERGRVHQCARHLDAARRPGRDHRDQARLRRSRVQAGGELHQVDDRASARRGGRGRGDLLGARDPRPGRAADHQLDNPDPDCDLDYVPNTARRMRDRRRAVEFLRLRRHQRHARVSQADLMRAGAHCSEP